MPGKPHEGSVERPQACRRDFRFVIGVSALSKPRNENWIAYRYLDVMDLEYLYPAIEPHETGFLEVTGGHTLAYEVSGNPDGQPVVFLHGGPGVGCVPDHRRFFDPKAYRIVLFDQRGAGRSFPNASIDNNTTQDLVEDIEALRIHLAVKDWVVFGGSWGSTLALAYGVTYPGSCRAFVLRGTWLCRQVDLDWWFRGIKSVFPDNWRAFAEFVPPVDRDNLLEAYFARLVDPDPAVHMPAAVAWKTYERRCATLLGGPMTDMPAVESTLAVSRLEAHYMRNLAFLGSGELLRGISRLRHLPSIMVHGRYDMICPIEGAFAVAEAWPEAELCIVPDAGHSAWEPGICKRLVEATDSFRSLESSIVVGESHLRVATQRVHA